MFARPARLFIAPTNRYHRPGAAPSATIRGLGQERSSPTPRAAQRGDDACGFGQDEIYLRILESSFLPIPPLSKYRHDLRVLNSIEPEACCTVPPKRGQPISLYRHELLWSTPLAWRSPPRPVSGLGPLTQGG